MNVRNRWYVSALALVVMGLIVFSCTSDSRAKPNFVFKDAPNTSTVAKIGDEVVTEEQLIGSEKLTYLDLQKKIYEFKYRRLTEIMQERLMAQEAKKAGMSVDDYINKKLASKISVSKKEYDQFVKERKIPDAQVTPQLKERIETFIKDQKKNDIVQSELAKLTKSSPVEVYFKKPKISLNVNIAQAPTWGKEDSKVTIIEFSDFQCPYCSKAADTMKEVKAKYKGKVRVAYKHFPLSFHPEAKPAAEASMCVNEQGNDKFWKFYGEVFKNQKTLDAASLETYAKTSGADVAKYKTCLQEKRYADLVQKDVAEGEQLGIRSTPTFLVNGELVNGALPIEAFSEVIDEALTSM